MDEISIIENALSKVYECQAIVDRVAERIKKRAEESAKKYIGQKVKANGHIYEVAFVKSRYYPYPFSYKKIEIILYLFVCSKLPKAKRERIEKVKQEFKNREYLPFNTFNIPLWYEAEYEISIEEVISGDIQLLVPDDIE